MSPTRRQVVNAIAAGAVVPVTVASAEAQEQDNQEFSPDITISPNNLVATIGERDDDVDPDTVTIYTADGDAHRFDGAAENNWDSGDAFDVGYTRTESRARIDGWHGVIEEVTARKGDERVRKVNEAESTLEVSCSLWQTPDQPPTQFSVVSEGARKQYSNRGDDDLSEDQRQYGSPGRPLQTVAERSRDIEMRVDFPACTPESPKALRFDCTSVTVEQEELKQGEDRIEDVALEFTDGSTENPPGTADEADNGAFEVPVTLEGTGENEGKVLDRIQFRVSDDQYTYWNLDAQNCSPQQDSETDSPEDTPEDTPENTDDGSSGGTSDDSTGPDADEETQTPERTETPTEESTPSQSGTGGSTGSDPQAGSRDTPTMDESGTPAESSNVTVNSTDESYTATDATSTEGTATPTNDSTGAGNATANGSDDPELADGTSSEDQPGMGVVSGLGGLLGFGELVRRRLDRDEDE